MDHDSGDRNYHGRLLWGYGELKGYPFASTKTAELTCEREGDQSKQKKSVGNREKVCSFFLQYNLSYICIVTSKNCPVG